MNNSEIAAGDRVLMENALRWTEGFANWSDSQMASLLAVARLNRLSKGERFAIDPAVAPSMLLMVSGYAMVYRSRGSASPLTLGLIGPGRVTGFGRADEMRDEAPCEFVAHSDVVAITLPAEVMLDRLDAEPGLWPRMARMMLRQQRESFNGLVDRVAGGLRERVAATIDRLATMYGVAETGGRSLRLRLSQEDLAALLHVSRQTINRELRALQADGILSPDYKCITIRDRRALRAAGGRVDGES